MSHDWHGIWIDLPGLGATAVLVIPLVFFREPPKKTAGKIITGRKEEALEMPKRLFQKSSSGSTSDARGFRPATRQTEPQLCST